jgi:hypothetical protein
MPATSGRGLGSRLETTVTGRDPHEPTSDPVTSPSPFCRSWSPLEGESVTPPVPSRCLTWVVATYGRLVSAGYYIVHVFCLHLYLLYYSNTRKSRNRVQCISSDLRGLLIGVQAVGGRWAARSASDACTVREQAIACSFGLAHTCHGAWMSGGDTEVVLDGREWAGKARGRRGESKE